MLKALEVLLPIFVTMGLGYGSARHGRFGAEQVPILNKVVMLYAIPMSISVDVLRLSRDTLLDNVGSLLVLTGGLAAVNFIAFALIRYAVRRDLATSALQAMAISFPAVPFIGPSLLTFLFKKESAILIASVALVGNIVIVPFTTVCLSMAAEEKMASAGPHASFGTTLRNALVVGVSQPIVWAPVLAMIIVLLGFHVGETFDNSLALLGQAGGGVGLFITGIVLQSQSVSLSPHIVASVVGKNVLTPLAVLGISYLAGQGANAGELAVTASIMAAPIIATLAIEYGVAVQEMSSTFLLSALASILTTGAFIVFAT
ncbi:MAG: AEC family transporter [Steroidobacteraceae bacterium]